MANLAQTLKMGVDVPLSQTMLLPYFYNLILATICVIILEKFYIRFASSLSNRRKLARNFLLITLTTTLVISIVKSSLALSLGLVGALSIVRFRTAIKEPEELAYLFLCLALGLGFGAGQTWLTIATFIFMLIILYWRWQRQVIHPAEAIFLNLTLPKTRSVSLTELMKKIETEATKIDIKRVDDQHKYLEVALNIELKNLQGLENLLKNLRKSYPSAQITVLDQSGLLL